MSIVSTCAYDARGRLVRPSQLDISRAKAGLDLDTGETLTFDRGHVHVHTVTASGLTAEHARDRVKAKLRRFFERAGLVAGYRKIAISRTEGVIHCNRNVTITYEILYAVEDDRQDRGHSPESPYAGYRRDRSAVAHA